ncbi:unnamed protein product [Mytilus coruscus]|uniref:Uncharacterized protein n=1 Tax=Mytilus coruscus TaxID=42192 RepID=A0A6J8BP77_MYTCO|nr:unnamed protein product [Mytilus coruscus]
MPLRNWCITTCCIQIVSFVTFLGLWTNTGRQVLLVEDNPISPENVIVAPKIDKFHRDTPAPCTEVRSGNENPLTDSCLPIKGIGTSCAAYFMGNNPITPLLNRKATGKCRLYNLVSNCSLFKLVHGYETFPVSEDEKTFPLAFAIKFHRLPEQAERLLRTIYRSHNVYCIYIDGKAPKLLMELMTSISKCLPNVHVVKNPINVVYASSAHMHTDFQCMKMVSKSNVKWKYYINLTGQEFPLKSNLEMVKILQALNGANDIESYSLPVFLKWRYEKAHKIVAHKLIDTLKKKEPFKYKMQMSKGSAYGAFTRQFVNFVLTDDVVQEYINWLNDTYSPEENIWATVNTLPWAPGGYMSEVRHRYGTFLSRAIIWEGDRVKCSGKFVRGVCVFSRNDLPWLVGQRQLFANKFDEYQDKVVLDCLESLIRNKTYHPAVHLQDWYHYHNLPHSKFYAAISNMQKDPEFLSRQKTIWLENQRNQKNYTLFERNIQNEAGLDMAGSSINVYQIYGKT